MRQATARHPSDLIEDGDRTRLLRSDTQPILICAQGGFRRTNWPQPGSQNSILGSPPNQDKSKSLIVNYPAHLNVCQRDVAPLAHPTENATLSLVQGAGCIEFLERHQFPPHGTSLITHSNFSGIHDEHPVVRNEGT